MSVAPRSPRGVSRPPGACPDWSHKPQADQRRPPRVSCVRRRLPRLCKSAVGPSRACLTSAASSRRGAACNHAAAAEPMGPLCGRYWVAVERMNFSRFPSPSQVPAGFEAPSLEYLPPTVECPKSVVLSDFLFSVRAFLPLIFSEEGPAPSLGASPLRALRQLTCTQTSRSWPASCRWSKAPATAAPRCAWKEGRSSAPRLTPSSSRCERSWGPAACTSPCPCFVNRVTYEETDLGTRGLRQMTFPPEPG